MALPKTEAPFDATPSALFTLQDRAARGEKLSEWDITQAIKEDIARGIPVSEVFLKKFVSGNRALSTAAVSSLIVQLQERMAEILMHSPDMYLAYAKATVLLTRELVERAEAKVS